MENEESTQIKITLTAEGHDGKNIYFGTIVLLSEDNLLSHQSIVDDLARAQMEIVRHWSAVPKVETATYYSD